MATDPFGGDKELKDVFFESVRVATDLAEKSENTLMPFAIGLRGEKKMMNGFPLPSDQVVEEATKVCRRSEFDVWALVWEGYVHLGGKKEDAFCFRVARNGEEKHLTFFWKYTRNPKFALVGNPGIVG